MRSGWCVVEGCVVEGCVVVGCVCDVCWGGGWSVRLDDESDEVGCGGVVG